MKIVYRLLFILHAFVGIGAMAGGLAAITNPEKPLGASVELLKNSPFSNFLIPGIILFVVIGLGNVISAFMFRFKSRFQGYISSVFSWALVIWIVVQCIMLHAIVFLHVLFFIIGLIQATLSMVILFEQRLFPTNLIRSFYEKITKEIDRNENILTGWKPIHDKGILAYVVPYALCFLVAIAAIVIVIFLIYRPDNTNTINSVIANNTIIIVIVTLGRVFEWFKREKQYKNAIQLLEQINKCPMCSAKTSPTDKVCPLCGVTLGIEDNKE